MKNVLFVEDDGSLVYLVKRFSIWQEGKFHLKAVAEDGAQAVDMLNKDSFDVVLTDIRMPRMDGIELLRYIHEKKINVEVILASDYSDFHYAREGIRLGAVDYIEKPYTKEKIEDSFRLLKKENTIGLLLQENDLYQDLLKNELQERWKAMDSIPKEQQAEILMDIRERLASQFCCIRHIEADFMTENLLGYHNDLRSYIQRLELLVRKYKLNQGDTVADQIGILAESYIGEDKLLDKIAGELELNKDYITRLFREKWGMPLSEYIVILKMDRAKQLLETTNYKVYEVAERLGYTTVDYFGRIFKNYVGCTPFKYKRTHENL